ncbi:hypothetical protein CEXT_17641 [Caerostris extrusa]|uniref:Uncharacterized protein n=1 Tax=Caerostris extrusa TaxID=172846 RepID=A0AAV4MSP6_CAEEX|nr:hypothetical protein CEXT_17641 [Caerostris extrusa]
MKLVEIKSGVDGLLTPRQEVTAAIRMDKTTEGPEWSWLQQRSRHILPEPKVVANPAKKFDFSYWSYSTLTFYRLFFFNTVGYTLSIPVGYSLSIPVGYSLSIPVGYTLSIPVGYSLSIPVGNSLSIPVGYSLSIPVGYSFQYP